MAAVTPSSVVTLSMGSTTGYVATFAGTVDNGDTWASGIPNIKHIIVTQNDDNTTQASAGAGATWSGSTITLVIGEDNTSLKLLVLAG